MTKVLTAAYILSATGVKAGVDEADSQLGRLGVSADSLSKDLDDKTSKMGSMFQRLGNSLGNFGLPFTGALTAMGLHLEEAKSKGGSYGKVLSDVGKIASGVLVAGVVAAGVETVHLGIDFQRSTDQLASSADISVAKAAAIGKAFRESGGQTIFSAQQMVAGLTPVESQLASVQGHALSTSQDLGFMANAANLAEAGNGNLSQSTSALAGVMQNFQIKVKGASGVADQLYTTSRLTGTGVSGLASTVVNLHSKLGVATPTLKSLDTLLVDMNEHGVAAGKGTRVLSSAVSSLESSTQKLNTAEKTASTTYGTKLTAAQDAASAAALRLAAAQASAGETATTSSTSAASSAASLAQEEQSAAAAVTAAQQRLAAAQTSTAQSSSAAQVAAANAVSNAETALAAKKAEIASKGAATVSEEMALQKLEMTLSQAQQKQAEVAATKSSSIASAQLALSQAQQRQAELSSASSVKGALATADANKTATSSSYSLQEAQMAYDQAEGKLQTVQAGANSTLSTNMVLLKNLKLHVFGAHGAVLGLGNIIGQLDKKFAHMTPQQRLANLGAVFGATANKALLATVMAGPAAYARAQKAIEQKNAAAKAAAKQDRAMGRQLEVLSADLKNAGATVGLYLIPKLEVLGRWGMNVLQFFEHSKVASIALASVVGTILAVAIGKFTLDKLGGLVKGVRSTISWFGKLGQLFTKQGRANRKAAADQSELDKAQQATAKSAKTLAEAQGSVEAATQKVADTQLTAARAHREATDAAHKATAAARELATAQAELAKVTTSGDGDMAAAEKKVADAQKGVTDTAELERKASLDRATADRESTKAKAGLTEAMKTEKTASAHAAEAADVEAGAQARVDHEVKSTSKGYGSLSEAQSVAAGESSSVVEANAAVASSYGDVAAAQEEIPAAAAAAGEAEGGLATASRIAGAAMDAAMGPIGMALMLLTSLGPLLLQHWKTITKDVSKAWDWLVRTGKDVFNDLWKFLKKWGLDILAVFDPMIGIPILLATHWKLVLKYATRIWGDIVGFFKAIPGELLGIFASAGRWFENVGRDLMHGLVVGFEYLTPIGLIIKFHDQILKALSSAGRWLVGAGKDVLKGLWTGFEYLTPIGLIVKFHRQILSGFKDAGRWLVGVGKDVLKGLWHGLVVGWDAIGNFSRWVWRNLMSGLKDAGRWLLDVGKDIVRGLWRGIKDLAGLPGKAIGDIAHGVIGIGKDILGIFSPSKVFADMGGNLMKGLAQGITGNKALPNSAVKEVDVVSSLDAQIVKLRATLGTLNGPATSAARALDVDAASSTRMNSVLVTYNRLATTSTAQTDRLTAGLAAGTGQVDQFDRSFKDLTVTLTSVLTTMGIPLQTKMKTVGDQMAKGLLFGIIASEAELSNASIHMITAVVNAIKSSLGVASPSKVMMAIGKDTGAGLAQGIAGTKGLVTGAMHEVANAITSVPITAPTHAAAAAVVAGAGTAGTAPGRIGSMVGNQSTVVTVNVAGHVWQTQDLANAVYAQLVNKSVTNGSRGQLPLNAQTS